MKFKPPLRGPWATADFAFQYVIGAVLATAAGIALLGIIVRIYFGIRHTSRELLQLRIFQEIDGLGRAILAMGIGIVGGVFLMLPTILQIDLPGVLYVAAGLPFFVLFAYGMVSLLRVFRFPSRKLV